MTAQESVKIALDSSQFGQFSGNLFQNPRFTGEIMVCKTVIRGFDSLLRLQHNLLDFKEIRWWDSILISLYFCSFRPNPATLA
jgi:hypothetical protein